VAEFIIDVFADFFFAISMAMLEQIVWDMASEILLA